MLFFFRRIITIFPNVIYNIEDPIENACFPLRYFSHSSIPNFTPNFMTTKTSLNIVFAGLVQTDTFQPQNPAVGVDLVSPIAKILPSTPTRICPPYKSLNKIQVYISGPQTNTRVHLSIFSTASRASGRVS